jgi:hypothetical protein
MHFHSLVRVRNYWLRGWERDVRDTDRDEAERLGERDTEEHQGLKTTLQLGLARDGLDRLADDDSYADTGADSGETKSEWCQLAYDINC